MVTTPRSGRPGPARAGVRLAVLAAVACGAAGACDFPFQPAPLPVTAVTDANWPHLMMEGDTAVLNAWLYTANGNLVETYWDFTWASDSPSVLQVANDSGWSGFARAVRVGTARISLHPNTLGLDTAIFVDSIRVYPAWRTLALGHSHACAAATFDRYCWGSGGEGALGRGTFADGSRPGPVPGMTAPTSPLVAGGRHTCTTRADNGVVCWGDNGWFQLGRTGASSAAPALVELAPGLTLPAASLAAGARHSCAATPVWQVFCWGSNSHGQLGTLDSASCPRTGEPSCWRSPSLVAGLEAVRLAAGADHSCGVTADDRAWCWGSNAYGQLGAGTADLRDHRPRRVASDLLAAQLTAGDAHTCLLTPAGLAYCWGDDRYGQLGLGSGATEQCDGTPCARTPAPVAGGLLFLAIAAGGATTCGVDTRGDAYCWGADDFLQLGTARPPDTCAGQKCSRLPRRVDSLPRLAGIAVGNGYACGIDPQGAVYCWGRNDHGQLGFGAPSPPRDTPIRVTDVIR